MHHAATTQSATASPISRVLRPIRGRLIFAGLLAAVGSMLTLIPLAGIAHIGQLVLAQQRPTGAMPMDAVWWTLGISVLSVLAGMALLSAAELSAHLADQHLTHQLRQATAQRLTLLPLGWFTSQSAGEIKQALQDDIATLHSLSAHFYTTLGRALGAILISVVFLLVLEWRLAAIVLLPFLGFLLFLRQATQASQAQQQPLFKQLGRLNHAAVEFVNGIAVIKTFSPSGQAHHGYRQAVDDFAHSFEAYASPLVAAMAQAHALIAPVTVLGWVLLSGTGAVLWGGMDAVDLLPFLLVAPGLSAPLLLLHSLLHDLGSATAAAQRVLGLLDTPILAQPEAGQQALPCGHEVCFEQVSYAYKQEVPALANIDLRLKPGTVTAVVGASGSGKSTLARLLLRFFDPSAGRITLGGVDLRQIASPQLYQRIGFVVQETQLIHASLRDNIALGRPAASQQDIEQAARAAHIHERILALPRGYDSVLGEDAELSGGERQRVCIARALLLDPPVLVLDEATAATDATTEAAIHEALAGWVQGRTVLVIAHRLDSVMHADHIVVLDQGAIAEQGRHAHLLAHNGLYARLWRLGGYDQLQTQEACAC